MTQNKGNLKLWLITCPCIIKHGAFQRSQQHWSVCQMNMWHQCISFLKPTAHCHYQHRKYSRPIRACNLSSDAFCYVSILYSHIGFISLQSLPQCLLGFTNNAASHLGQNEVFQGIFYNHTAHLSGTAFVSEEHWNSAETGSSRGFGTELIISPTADGKHLSAPSHPHSCPGCHTGNTKGSGEFYCCGFHINQPQPSPEINISDYLPLHCEDSDLFSVLGV